MEQKLELLLAEGVIDAILGRLKSGKEADIWIVEHCGKATAAKLYKERQSRSFKNNADYKEGRVVGNSRTRRAISRGSRFGKAAEEDAWKSAESDTLFRLYEQGVRTPAPVMFYEGILLMELVVDGQGQPAPRLIDSVLSPDTAQEIYLDLRSQVVRMLSLDTIHGDLSPYNVLLGAHGPTIIDFPQVISSAHNSRSEFFFQRDLENLRRHLSSFDPRLGECFGDAKEIWSAYVRRELTPDFIPARATERTAKKAHSPTSSTSNLGQPTGFGPGPGPRPSREALPRPVVSNLNGNSGEQKKLALQKKQSKEKQGPKAPPESRSAKQSPPSPRSAASFGPIVEHIRRPGQVEAGARVATIHGISGAKGAKSAKEPERRRDNIKGQGTQRRAANSSTFRRVIEG